MYPGRPVSSPNGKFLGDCTRAPRGGGTHTGLPATSSGASSSSSSLLAPSRSSSMRGSLGVPRCPRRSKTRGVLLGAASRPVGTMLHQAGTQAPLTVTPRALAAAPGWTRAFWEGRRSGHVPSQGNALPRLASQSVQQFIQGVRLFSRVVRTLVTGLPPIPYPAGPGRQKGYMPISQQMLLCAAAASGKAHISRCGRCVAGCTAHTLTWGGGA